MKRRKLDAGNFPSWEERIDYQLDCAVERGHDLRATDLDLYSKVGYLEGRADRAAADKDLIALRIFVNKLVLAVVVLSAVVVALFVMFIWSVTS